MSSTVNRDMGDKNSQNDKVIVMELTTTTTEDEQDPIIIDDEQLEEYQEMVEELGTFAERVKINSLSMIAEDYAESKKNASMIYQAIRKPLVSKQVPGDRKLPLVYVLDSILKIVKGKYVAIIEVDAKQWMPLVHQSLSDEKRGKLKKVWNLWKDAGVFSSEASWKEIGACFSTDTTALGGGGDGGAGGGGGVPISNSALEKAGISWGKDGGLLLMPALRDAMQTILDEIQSDEKDELNKVSLERLANIDPDLLIKIKRTAEDAIRNGAATSSGGGGTSNNDMSKSSQSTGTGGNDSGNDEVNFLIETRSMELIERSKTWDKLELDIMNDTNDIVATLQQLVREGSNSESTARYTQIEAIGMTSALASSAATAGIMTTALQQFQKESKQTVSLIAGGGSTNSGGPGGSGSRGFFAVDKKLFTNEGLKKKNDSVIAMLYEVGLPFVSSSDGRRFATQIELSKHLDALFKKGQLEKTMARTEERGWYVSDITWCGETDSTGELGGKSADSGSGADGTGVGGGGGTTTKSYEEADPDTFIMPADESRNRCVICGINFKMFFDNDNGMFMYKNCREVEVLNDDDVALNASEQMLVHVTCWRGLGSPAVLSRDQALQL